MRQVVIRNISDWALASLEARARSKGVSLEHEIRTILEQAAELKPQERVVAAREIQSMTKGSFPSLSLDEIREGLE